MKVVLDTSVLVYLINPNAPAPLDPSTGKHVPHCQQRIEGLLEDLDESAVQLVLPTPVLSELLIRAGDRQIEVLAALSNKKSVQILPFDQFAAVENAQLRRTSLSKKARGESKKEVSFDLQILAIARVARAKMILSDDVNLRKRARQAGMEVHGIADLGLPESKRQMGMFVDPDESVGSDGAPEEAPEEKAEEAAGDTTSADVGPTDQADSAKP